MPYYQERRGVDAKGAYRNVPYPVILDQSKCLTYRSRPSMKELSFVEIPDFQADPYAYFLRSIAERDYSARLAERNLPSRGAPDRGHAFDLSKHTYYGPLATWRTYDPRGINAESSFKNSMIMAYPVGSNQLNSVHDGTAATPATYQGTGLDIFAQQAYSKVAPTSVQFDAAQFLGELHEGLPRLSMAVFKDMAHFYKGLGSDYLNAEFGWKPFIQDLQNAAKALMSATQLLSQQGKRVHRKLGLPRVTKADEFTGNGNLTGFVGATGGFLDASALNKLGYPVNPGNVQMQIGTCSLDYLKSSSVDRWFEGEFSLFFPLDFDPNNFISRFNQLVNLKITPAVLWELTPWSWLVDWFLRIQDTIVANQKAANDLLVMHYGYAMETTRYTTVASYRNAVITDTFYSKTEGFPLRAANSAVTVYKKRLRANPFGFKAGGEASLTQGQITILGALGASKTR